MAIRLAIRLLTIAGMPPSREARDFVLVPVFALVFGMAGAFADFFLEDLGSKGKRSLSCPFDLLSLEDLDLAIRISGYPLAADAEALDQGLVAILVLLL